MVENDENIVSYTAEELREMVRRGEDRTDLARVDAMTDEDIEASIDPEEEGEFDWSTVYVGLPHFIAKGQFMISIDKDVPEWFKAQTSEYPQAINDVLRGHIEAEKRKAREAEQPAHGAAAHR